MKNNRLFFVFIVITLITSWFSVGFYNVDEHFQILEFGGWKAGWIPQQNLAWEFSKAIRSSMEPWIVFLLIEGLHVIHADNPFIVAFFMRLITAALCISCFLLWRNKLRRKMPSASNLIWYDAALLLWFIPYLCVRSSSEVWGGAVFFISLSLIYRREFSSRDFFISGLLAAFAFFLRFQIGFLIVAVLLYRLFAFKRNFKNLVWYTAGFLIASLIGVILDFLFYHRWCITPWNYFHENIISGRADTFSTEPFYYYLLELLTTLLPLQGFAIILAAVIFIARKIRDEISLSILIFVLAHSFAAHKEIRFLIPLVFMVPFVLADSVQWIRSFRFTKSSLLRFLIWITVVINIVILPIVMFKPADTQVSFQKNIDRIIGAGPATLVYVQENPFSRVRVTMEFYKSKNMRLLPVYLMPQYLATNPGEPVYAVTLSNVYPKWEEEKNLTPVYQSIPQWVTQFDFNDWLSRTRVFQLYKISGGTQ